VRILEGMVLKRDGKKNRVAMRRVEIVSRGKGKMKEIRIESDPIFKKIVLAYEVLCGSAV
jgi:hypothetical protein